MVRPENETEVRKPFKDILNFAGSTFNDRLFRIPVDMENLDPIAGEWSDGWNDVKIQVSEGRSKLKVGIDDGVLLVTRKRVFVYSL